MRNINSLKSKDFKKVYEKGKSYANKYLIMYLLKEENIGERIGISVSKKVGNSVVRHRVTRLIRESYRLNKCLMQYSDYSIAVIARNTAKDKTFFEIESAFLHLCKLHVLIENGKFENNKD